MLSHFSCVQFCNPMDGSPPDSSVHGIFQARILEQVAIFCSRGILPTQGQTRIFVSYVGKQILYHGAAWLGT